MLIMNNLWEFFKCNSIHSAARCAARSQPKGRPSPTIPHDEWKRFSWSERLIKVVASSQPFSTEFFKIFKWHLKKNVSKENLTFYGISEEFVCGSCFIFLSIMEKTMTKFGWEKSRIPTVSLQQFIDKKLCVWGMSKTMISQTVNFVWNFFSKLSTFFHFF